jgi:hypothetical protein
MKKNAHYLLLLSSFLIMGMVVNSCKKSNQSPIQALFTGGRWELASVMATNYIGNQQISMDTLNVNCDSTQYFIFNTDNTCTYTNFDCIPQKPAAAAWSLSPNELVLDAQVVCKDTTLAGSSKPFSNAEIENLGQFSLVLLTGDIAPNYSLTQKRRVVTWGFIRETLNGSD